jgi:hypothetical protein
MAAKSKDSEDCVNHAIAGTATFALLDRPVAVVA